MGDVAGREHIGLVDRQLVQRQRACTPMPLAHILLKQRSVAVSSVGTQDKASENTYMSRGLYKYL